MEKLARVSDCVNARIEKWLSGLENRESFRCLVFVVLFALIAANIYLLNAEMPLILDDYDFMYSWATGELLDGFPDVIRSQIVHYKTWGGRLLHVFTQSFLYMGKTAFNVANTVMFMLLLLEIYLLAKPERRFCWTILLIAYLSLMTMLPFFGTVFLWLTGACIYLWGTVFALIPLLIVRCVKEKKFFARGRFCRGLCFCLGILGGWTNENTTCGIIAVVFVFLLIDYLKTKYIEPNLAWMFAGQCIGALFLLLAPGNQARASVYAYDSMALEIMRRFVAATGYGMSYLGVPLAGVMLIYAGMRKKAKRASIAAAFVFAAAVSVYAMVGSPELSDRTFTGAFVLVLTAMLVLIADAEAYFRNLDAAKVAVLPLALVFMIYTGYHAYKDVSAYAEDWMLRIHQIETACEAGEERVILEPIRGDSRYVMSISLEKDADAWPNSTLSKYYGISILGE